MTLVDKIRSALSKRTVRYTIAIIVLVLIVLILYLTFVTDIKGVEMFESSGPKPEFVMYYADWCPHCQKAKPGFMDLMKDAAVSEKVVVRMVNADTEQEEVKNAGVTGFPTFIMKVNGENKTYEGPRTLSGYKQFIMTNA
jgi:thiol-disulfide isomerase/thioredoxin